MSEQMIIVPNQVLKEQQQQQISFQQSPTVQYVNQISKDPNTVYVQSPVIRKSINAPSSYAQQQFFQQSLQSPKVVEFQGRQQQQPTQNQFKQQINQSRSPNFKSVLQSIQNGPVRVIADQELTGTPIVRQAAQSQYQIQPIQQNQYPTQVVTYGQPVQQQQSQQAQVPYASQQIVLANSVFQQIQNQQQSLVQQEQEKYQTPGILQLVNQNPQRVKQQQQQRNLTRRQSLQNLQSYQQFYQSQQQPNKVSQEKQDDVRSSLNGNLQKQPLQVSVRQSNLQESNRNTVQDDNQTPQAIQQSQSYSNYNLRPQEYQMVSNRVSEAAGPTIQNYTQVNLQSQSQQQNNNDKKHIVVKERVHVVQDIAKIDELEAKIKSLQNNIELQNKAIHSKESEIADLYTKLLEVDHLKRAKERIEQENQSLKLQIEEWQRRYNVLELQVFDKPKTQFIATGYSAYDAERLYNSLKIKQEENEALKTTIARLELNQGQDKILKEELQRFTDLVDLKTKQCEEWKNKYMNQEILNNKYKIRQDYQEQIISGTLKDNVQVNSETPKMSMIFNEQNGAYNNLKDVTQLARLVHEKDETPKRSANSVSYNTSALFKKKYELNSPTNAAILGTTSYIDDLKQNKKQKHFY
ncbi:hypothetical protein ABPG72_008715 [Tetrahymena utriculariae]